MNRSLTLLAFIGLFAFGAVILVGNIRDCRAKGGVYLDPDAVCVRGERVAR